MDTDEITEMKIVWVDDRWLGQKILYAIIFH